MPISWTSRIRVTGALPWTFTDEIAVVLSSDKVVATSTEIVMPRDFGGGILPLGFYSEVTTVPDCFICKQQLEYFQAPASQFLPKIRYEFGELVLPSTLNSVVTDVIFNPPIDLVVAQIAELDCDFDDDNQCNATDVDLMHSLGPIASGVPAAGNEQFDLNGDGSIDLTDRDEWLAIAATENGFGSPYKLGDANADGVVDGQDFIAWNGAKFTNDLLRSRGDFNADGVVDGQDFILWNATKFTSSDGVNTVPEPATATLLCGAMLFLVAGRRRR